MNKLWKSIVLGSAASVCLLATSAAIAAPMTYEFEIDGFFSGGSVTGSFTGEDLNNDGYLSSFIFSQAIDFENNDFSPGMNEISHVTATYNGSFDANVPEFFDDPVTQFTIQNDLTDLSDNFMGIPLDLFFMFNYKLGGGFLGDDPLEGLLFGEFDQSMVLGMGAFLPGPAGTTIPGGDGSLPGGITLTSGLILGNSNGMPCVYGSVCGAVHSVRPEIAIGGFDLTTGLVKVRRVSAPSTAYLIAFCGLVFGLMKRR